MANFKNHLLLVLISFSTILFSQNDSTKWYKKFHTGVVVNNYNYRGPSNYSKNFGIVGIGVTGGYDELFLEAGYVFGYDYSKKNTKKTIQKPEGSFFKGIWYMFNKPKVRIGLGGYGSFYFFTLNYKDYWGTPHNVKFVSAHRNVFLAIDYKLYSKLKLIGELHFGDYESYNLSATYNHDAYRTRNIGLNVGLKYLFF